MGFMPTKTPVIWWVRRDMRLADNPCLAALVETGRPVIPVFLLDEVLESHGAAPKWRMGLAAECFAERLAGKGSRLIFRRGGASRELGRLAEETGAGAVWWTRAYDAEARSRDRAVYEGLKDRVDVRAVDGHLLMEPWSVRTGSGGPYKVYTPFWRAVKDRGPGGGWPRVSKIPAPGRWPESENIADWNLGREMRRGAAVVREHVRVGEAEALKRLRVFARDRLSHYGDARDDLARPGTSELSEHLTYGEIGPRTCWDVGERGMREGAPGAEAFLKELVWREFAHHLMWHFPDMAEANWRSEWDAFPWKTDERSREVRRWKEGRTGVEIVDAAQREMYVTGTMHNRARMITASYLTKHCLVDWRVGRAWFEDCLIDWDPASNALGWQWVAGSGPDAAPYFRVFNPESQAEKFDVDRRYRDRWLAEGRRRPSRDALSYFDAIPERWSMAPGDVYPDPVVGVKEGREAALRAYRDFKS